MLIEPNAWGISNLTSNWNIFCFISSTVLEGEDTLDWDILKQQYKSQVWS